MVISHLIEEELLEKVEYSETSCGFKINLEMKKFPEGLTSSFKRSTRRMVSNFGKTKQSFRFLSCKLLTENTILQLKYLLESLDSWRDEIREDWNENRYDYAEQFYAYANGDNDNSSSISDSSKVSGMNSYGLLNQGNSYNLHNYR